MFTSAKLASLGASRASQWPWPLPALAVWTLAWLVWWLATTAGLHAGTSLAMASGVGGLLAWGCRGWTRRAIAGLGFPLSAWSMGYAQAWPAWVWLAPLLPLLLVYPLRAWRDAPFFPTPARALLGLDGVVCRPRRVLDAGCGLGHGLRALHGLWPEAELQGVEWSPLLAAAARLACPWARVRRGDLWAQGWAGLDLVYVFQRPESMARLWAKACAELPASAWLVSLEFAVPGIKPWARLQHPGQRPLWIYRPVPVKAGSTGARPGR
jgi:SAM-dependent methyltransferase